MNAASDATRAQPRRQPASPPQRPGPRIDPHGPADDLIRNHRDQMRAIYERHHRELQHPAQPQERTP